jgi:hypothetical protein
MDRKFSALAYDYQLEWYHGIKGVAIRIRNAPLDYHLRGSDLFQQCPGL